MCLFPQESSSAPALGLIFHEVLGQEPALRHGRTRSPCPIAGREAGRGPAPGGGCGRGRIRAIPEGCSSPLAAWDCGELEPSHSSGLSSAVLSCLANRLGVKSQDASSHGQFAQVSSAGANVFSMLMCLHVESNLTATWSH